MIASLQLAQSQAGSGSVGNEKLISLALNSAENAAHLIRDLLDYCKVGGQETAMADVEMKEVVSAVIDNLGTEIREAGARIWIGELPVVHCNRLLIGQLFQNLISNAIKYRSERPPEVRVTATRQQHGWSFAVRDNGVGMPADQLEKIFDPFYRIPATCDRPGTGIGLATCDKIVRAHGGKIWAESEQGKGTTFYFVLPRPEDLNIRHTPGHMDRACSPPRQRARCRFLNSTTMLSATALPTFCGACVRASPQNTWPALLSLAGPCPSLSEESVISIAQ